MAINEDQSFRAFHGDSSGGDSDLGQEGTKGILLADRVKSPVFAVWCQLTGGNSTEFYDTITKFHDSI